MSLQWREQDCSYSYGKLNIHRHKVENSGSIDMFWFNLREKINVSWVYVLHDCEEKEEL